MSKEYITYHTTYKGDNNTLFFLNDCMQKTLHYKTKRFSNLKKRNLLGVYDKKDSDNYRDTQTFINYKQKISTVFDTRYSRAIDISIQSMCSSYIDSKKIELEEKEIKIEQVLKIYNKFVLKYTNIKKNNIRCKEELYSSNKTLNKYLKLKQNLESKIAYLKKEIENPTYQGFCFGGKSLFMEQFQEGVNFDNWLNKWKNRGDEFECGGSKSEEWGNKKFQLTLSKKQPFKGKTKFDLKISVPYCLQEKYGKIVILQNITFPRGENKILENVLSHGELRNQKLIYNNCINKIKKQQTLLGQNYTENVKHKVDDIKHLKALPQNYGCESFSFLIKKHNNGRFSINSTMPIKKVKIITSDKKGVISIDINHNNIAMCEIDHLGKLINSKVYRFNFGHTNKGQYREIQIFTAIKNIVEHAKRKNKDVVIENLNFARTKSKQVANIEKNYNRMLHTLAYAKIGESFRTNCYKLGVTLHKVNPAYTSMLGKTLYAKKYGISTHQSAAYVIGRRHYNLSENYNAPTISFLYKAQVCSLEIPDGIFKEQNKKSSPTIFWKKINQWLGNELKAPSRFINKSLLVFQEEKQLKYTNCS